MVLPGHVRDRKQLSARAVKMRTCGLATQGQGCVLTAKRCCGRRRITVMATGPAARLWPGTRLPQIYPSCTTALRSRCWKSCRRGRARAWPTVSRGPAESQQRAPQRYIEYVAGTDSRP